jgi:DNA polymerase IV
MEPRRIIHIDMDAFYASIEQRDDPGLRGRPIAVGHGAKRGVVAAASYEARTFGVRSAMPSATALRKCPDLIFVRPRFEAYRAVSREIQAIFFDYTPLVEPLSLDEAYLDVTENLRGLATATETATEIRARIFETVGLTASAGISYNKLIAKLASDQRKPNGQFVVTPSHGAQFVQALPIARFHGIGPVTAEKMKQLGIHTGADLASQPLAFLEEHFGNAAAWYYAIARGEDHRPVVANRIRKSSGSERTFSEDLRAPAEIEAGIIEMADDVWAWCEKTGTYGHTVTAKIKYADFRIVTRSKTVTSPIRTKQRLRDMSVELVRTIYPVEAGIRLLGVSISKLARPGSEVPQLEFELDPKP